MYYTMYVCVGVCICIKVHFLPSTRKSSTPAVSAALSSAAGTAAAPAQHPRGQKPMKIEAFNWEILANPLINPQKKWFTNGDSKGTSNFYMRWRYTE